MARGTTTDLTATGTQVITKALYEIAMYGPHDTIPAAELADCLITLDWMIKLWQGSPDIETKGLKMWQRARGTLTLDASISRTLKSGGDLAISEPVAIISAMLVTTDSEETALTPMTLQEYEAISDKTQTGTPKKYYYEREYDGSTIYFDCIPVDITDVVHLLYLRPLYDMDAIGNNVDFPQHWYMPLYLNLAVILAPGYGKEAYRTTIDAAFGALQKAQNFYPETVNLHFEPDRDD